MRTENWYGHEIRFVEINGEWYAILKDICDALKLRTDKIASRLHPEMLERIKIGVSNNPLRVVRSNNNAQDLRHAYKSIDRIDQAVIGKDIGRQLVKIRLVGCWRLMNLVSIRLCLPVVSLRLANSSFGRLIF